MANVDVFDGLTLTPVSDPKVVCPERNVDIVDKDCDMSIMPTKEFSHKIQFSDHGHSSSCTNGDSVMNVDDHSSVPCNTESNVKGETKKEHVENGKGCIDQQALQDVGNKFSISITETLPKKSLLKRPKSENSPDVSINPRKRIKIIENLDTVNSDNIIQLADNAEIPEETLEGVDDLASVVEVSSCGETVRWLNSPSSAIDQASINATFVRDNLSPVNRTFSVEIDMRFTLTETCTAILGCKSKIAKVGASDFHVWTYRKQALDKNPKLQAVTYKENFLKMANIDAVLNFDLTSPSELTKEVVTTQNNESIYYVGDLWQDSRGFREYILRKASQLEKNFSTKIFAMRTLGPFSVESDVKLKTGKLFSKSHSNVEYSELSTENVEAYGSTDEYHNILDVAKMDSFVQFVHLRTGGKGLHTFIVDNNEISYAYESCREVRFQKYFYCQCLLALRSLREGGTFVCKIFDTCTLFTNGLLFLMYKCFKNIAIHKPSSSSSSSAERFLICKGKIDNADLKYVIDFLLDCVDMVVNNQEQRKIVRRRVRKRLTVLKMEVLRIVPLKLILSHSEFFQFVRESNIRLTDNLAASIDELCKLIEQKDQARLKQHIKSFEQARQPQLSLWNLPISSSAQQKLDPTKRVEEFLAQHGISTEVCALKDLKLEAENQNSIQKDLLVFPIQSSSTGNIVKSKHGWFFGCGESKILNLENNVWTLLEVDTFSLPFGTLVLGEMSEEIKITEKVKKFIPSFHIFDVLFVRGTYIGSFPFNTRQEILTRFVSTIKNTSTNMDCSVTSTVNLKQLNQFYLSTKSTELLGYNKLIRHYMRKDEDSAKLTLVDGYLITTNLQDLSASDFFNRFQQLLFTWDKEEEEMKVCLGKLESRLG